MASIILPLDKNLTSKRLANLTDVYEGFGGPRIETYKIHRLVIFKSEYIDNEPVLYISDIYEGPAKYIMDEFNVLRTTYLNVKDESGRVLYNCRLEGVKQ